MINNTINHINHLGRRAFENGHWFLSTKIFHTINSFNTWATNTNTNIKHRILHTPYNAWGCGAELLKNAIAKILSTTLVKTAPNLCQNYFGFNNPENKYRTLLASSIFAMNLIELSLAPMYRKERQEFFKLIAKPELNTTKLMTNLIWLCGATVGFSFTIALRSYLVGLLAASLSNQMKEAMNDKYLKDGASNLIKFANDGKENINPAQVIVEDISEATLLISQLWDSRLNSILSFSQAFMTLWAFSDILEFMLMGFTVSLPYLPFVCIIYALLYNLGTDIISKDLYKANALYSQIKDILYKRIAFQDTFAESLQFKTMNDSEQNNNAKELEHETKIRNKAVKTRARLRMYNATHYRIREVIPAIFMAIKKIHTKEMIDIGLLWDLAEYFGNLCDFFTWHSDNVDSMATIDNSAQRINNLNSLLTSCQQLMKCSKIKIKTSKAAVVLNGTINSNTNKQLLLLNNIKLTQGRRYWLEGPSGCGKTTLLRTLSRQWPWGKGTFSIPKQTIFIPQNPVILPDNSALINSILPQIQKLNPDFELTNRNTKEIKKVMREIEFDEEIINHLTENTWISNGIQQKANWSKTLSGGECARIGLIPLFFVKADLIILDEPFSAINPTTRNKILQKILSQFENSTILFTHHGELRNEDEVIPFWNAKLIITKNTQDAQILQLVEGQL